MSSTVETGAINSVDVSSVPMTESRCSVNCVQFRTADGTRIPNLGQKTFEALSEQADRRDLQAATSLGPLECCSIQAHGVATFPTSILGSDWFLRWNWNQERVKPGLRSRRGTGSEALSTATKSRHSNPIDDTLVVGEDHPDTVHEDLFA